MYEEFKKYFSTQNTIKVVFSIADRDFAFKKTSIKPIELKCNHVFQVENFDGKKAFHKNLSEAELLKYIKDEVIAHYKEINIINRDNNVIIKSNKKGKPFVKASSHINDKKVDLSHNKNKQYLLEEGMQIDALVDLGVFSADYKIIKSKYSKYKQINKFVEIIDHALKDVDLNNFTILDFGCGKSYLTFILYYYFTKVRGSNVNIIGYDLKQDVVDSCNKIASKYGYKNLEFINGNIANAEIEGKKIDMMISLHACDIATDYALEKAVKNNVKYIFSVPCCQHEINAQIKTEGELALLLKYGLIKERFSALLTDAIRCRMLESQNYSVDVIEFVDFDHSPKNLMIRAVKNSKSQKNSSIEDLDKLLADLNISPTLVKLL